IIDGRFHESCQHFIAISTRRQDCLHPSCLFSNRHPASTSKTGRSLCIRSMRPPFLNAIRLSPTTCPDCATAE
ncbi:hypothetical protein EI94DRAFT_1451747, partial [Lactarius quietus]